MDQSRSVVPLMSAKERELGKFWREKCTRARWVFLFKMARTSSFRQKEQVWENSKFVCNNREIPPLEMMKSYQIQTFGYVQQGVAPTSVSHEARRLSS